MQIDWWTLVLQTINFGVVVWLLSRFLYQPIKHVIEDREAANRKIENLAEKKIRTAENTRKDFEAKRAALSDQQRQEETKLHAEMAAERQAMLDAAEEEARALVRDARDRIERERKQALDALGDQIVDLARDMTRKALAGNAQPGEGLLERVNTHIDGLSDNDLSELRTDAAGAEDGLCIVTAAELADPQKTRWRATIGKHFPEVAIGFETDPSIIGGAELRFPHAVLSFSVADRLQRAAEDLRG